MISVLLAHVIDGQIVHYEGESDWPCFVQPEASCVAIRVITKRYQTRLQQLVGKLSRLFQSVHEFPDFNVNLTVESQSLEVVLVNYFFWEA
jgi:hypothetical protein